MLHYKGKLIVIEGLDGSGKTTQSDRIFNILSQSDMNIKQISYPDYSKPSSTLVKMYLDGEFSTDLNNINPYAASSFYAVDRYASFKQYWQKYYERGYTILATRYVSSNAIHQMVKLPQEQWDDFICWLNDYEHDKLGLPKPDCVIFLDMPRTIANQLIIDRYDGDASKRDIHESNMQYMDSCQKSARYCAEQLGWHTIMCAKDGKPLSLDDITKQIIDIITLNTQLQIN